MSRKHTLNELNNMSREDLITIVLTMQGQLDTLNDNIEKLIEQVRLANQHRFGRSTETLKSIDGQLSFFDEADTLFDPNAVEPDAEEIIPAKPRKKKNKRAARYRPERFSGRDHSNTRYFRRCTGCFLWKKELETHAG